MADIVEYAQLVKELLSVSSESTPRLTDSERHQYPEIASHDIHIQSLLKDSAKFYESLSCAITKMRSNSHAASETKITAFRLGTDAVFGYFQNTAINIINKISDDLLCQQPKVLQRMYNEARERYNTSLISFERHAKQDLSATHMDRYLIEFQKILETTYASFHSVISPLNIALNTKLQPILRQREKLYYKQVENVTEKREKVSELATEMKAMQARRTQLQEAEAILDRMFEALSKFRDTGESEEEN